MPTSPTTAGRPASKDQINISQITEDQEARIRTIEKHLYAERQLTQTLEEALTDLEKQSNKVKADCDAWKKRASELETEVKGLKDRPAAETQQDNRWSVQAVEEERKKRQAAEAARRQLEERMNHMNKSGGTVFEALDLGLELTSSLLPGITVSLDLVGLLSRSSWLQAACESLTICHYTSLSRVQGTCPFVAFP